MQINSDKHQIHSKTPTFITPAYFFFLFSKCLSLQYIYLNIYISLNLLSKILNECLQISKARKIPWVMNFMMLYFYRSCSKENKEKYIMDAFQNNFFSV